jgi:hypothetical protein
MKYSFSIAILFVLSAGVLSAKSQKEMYIETASQFQKWCKHLSYRHFRRKKLQAYNWSASTIRQLNDYQTTGSWKVNRKKRQVLCQIRIGKKAKYTLLEIH